jgi:hypothetical protein
MSRTTLAEPTSPFDNPERPSRLVLQSNFEGFVQLSVAKEVRDDLDESELSICRECHSLIVYEPAWPELPKKCDRCY